MNKQDNMRTRLRRVCGIIDQDIIVSCHISFWLCSVPWYAGEALPWPRFQGFKNFSVFNEHCSRYMPVIDLADELQKVMVP